MNNWKSNPMFIISALVAIVGAISYQYFVKKISPTINPIVSILAVYLGVLVLGVFLLLLFPAEGGLSKHIRELTWTQAAVAGSVFLLELGFLLMYRFGWNLSTGNLVTGIFVNLGLLMLGVLLAGEKISTVNAAGIVLSIIGVALISYSP
jgi:drug/metabolite transporter (DMT)-like permease